MRAAIALTVIALVLGMAIAGAFSLIVWGIAGAIPLPPDDNHGPPAGGGLGRTRGDEGAAGGARATRRPAVRATALGALARAGRLEPDRRGERAFEDPAPEVRARAVEVAIGLGPAAAAGVRRALGDGDARVVEAGCFALGELGSERGADGGVEALAGVGRDHPDPLCREAAVAALGAIGDPAGLPAILVGHRATSRPCGGGPCWPWRPSTVPRWRRRSSGPCADRDWQVRQAAEDLTGRRGPA